MGDPEGVNPRVLAEAYVMPKPTFSMVLRWYIGTKLLQYAALLMQRDLTAREARAFNALGDAILADERWTLRT
jgi:hypothetical protein